MQADAQMNYGLSSVHVQWFSHGKVEQMIMTSFYDVTMIPPTIEEGKYIRRVSTSLGAVGWVFRTE